LKNKTTTTKTTAAKRKKKNKGLEFSKVLLIQESILVWITTLSFIVLAFFSIQHDFIGELGWLTALCTAIWAAYGVSQACYYKKAMAENTRGGIKYQLLTQESEYMGTETAYE
jgi:hypothetical protein